MFCSKCGTENADGAKFCKGCGVELAVAPKQETDVKKDETNVKETETIKKGISPKLIGIAAAIVAALVVFLMITSKPTIDLSKYTKIETSGYDGYGQARAVVDWEAIRSKYGKKLKFEGDAKAEYDGVMTPMDLLEGSVKISFDENNGKLTNGDKVAYTWTVDEKLSEMLNCKVKYKDGSVKAKNLTEVAKFDPFKDLTVTFEGVSPGGRVKVEYTGDVLETKDFTYDEDAVVANGGTVKISLKKQEMSYYAEKYGKIPAMSEKEYEVTGLDEMLASIDDIDDAFAAKLHKETEDSIRSYISAVDYDWKEANVESVEPAGYFLVVPNYENERVSDKVAYSMVYDVEKVTISFEALDEYDMMDTEFTSTLHDGKVTVYYAKKFSNVVKGQDGCSYDHTGHDLLHAAVTSPEAPVPCDLYVQITEEETYPTEWKVLANNGFEAYEGYTPVNKLDEISDDSRKNLVDYAIRVVEDYVPRTFDVDIKEYSYVGDAILVEKSMAEKGYEMNGAQNYNTYWIILECKISNGSLEGSTSIYCGVQYNGLIKLPDGSSVALDCVGVSGGPLAGPFTGKHGFVEPADLYDWVITDWRSTKECDVSDGFAAFER